MASVPERSWPALFRFRGRVRSNVELGIGIASFIAILLLWTLVAELGWVSPQFLPSPLVVLQAVYRLFANQNFAADIGISLYRVWLAFIISALMAIPLGILMSSYRIVGAVTEPVVDFIRYLPVPALVPLTLIWLGIGEMSKITLLWLGTFFQLVLLVADDMRRVPHEYVETALTLGAKPRQVLSDVAFRAMLPSLVDSLRITLGWCWTYLIIAEIVAAQSGIGFVIWTARRYMKTPEVMAGVIAIGIIGLVTDQLLRALHRRAFRYL